MHILVVEDSPLLQRMYGLAFPQRIHQLTTANNGHEALAALDGSRAFDLILLDLRMPDMNGVEFLRALRERGALGRVPVVVTTAEAEGSPLLAEARTFGIAAIVRKPWKPQDLQATIATLGLS